MSEFKLNHVNFTDLGDIVVLDNGTSRAEVSIDLFVSQLDALIVLLSVTQSEAKDDGYKNGFEDGYSDGKYDGGCHRCRQ